MTPVSNREPGAAEPGRERSDGSLVVAIAGTDTVAMERLASKLPAACAARPAAVRAAQHSQRQIVRRGLNVRTNGSVEAVTLVVEPLDQPQSLRGLRLVTCAVEEKGEVAAAIPSEQTSNLEAELYYEYAARRGA